VRGEEPDRSDHQSEHHHGKMGRHHQRDADQGDDSGRPHHPAAAEPIHQPACQRRGERPGQVHHEDQPDNRL
jgi:hypothetical protein